MVYFPAYDCLDAFFCHLMKMVFGNPKFSISNESFMSKTILFSKKKKGKVSEIKELSFLFKDSKTNQLSHHHMCTCADVKINEFYYLYVSQARNV